MFFYNVDQLDFAMSSKPIEKVVKTCKDLSDTFHWNIEVRIDNDFYWVYSNDKLINCFSEFDLAKNTDIICDRVEKIVRNLAE